MFHSLKRRLNGFGGGGFSSEGGDGSGGTPNNNNDNNNNAATSSPDNNNNNNNNNAAKSLGRRNSAPMTTDNYNNDNNNTGPKQRNVFRSYSNSRYNKSSHKQRSLHDLTKKGLHLSSFDACVAAADTLAVASNIPMSIIQQQNSNDEQQQEQREQELNDSVGNETDSPSQVMATCNNSSLTRLDRSTGLIHTSVLISPDGVLLLVPPAMMNLDSLPIHKYFSTVVSHSHTHNSPAFLLTPTKDQDDNSPQKSNNNTPSPDIVRRLHNEGVADELDTAEQQRQHHETRVHESDQKPNSNSQQTPEEQQFKDTHEKQDAENKDRIESKKNTCTDPDGEYDAVHSPVRDEDDEGEKASMFSELLWNNRDEYAAAIFYGHDLHPQGDAALNGFSAKGWSLPATSFALRQAQASLEHWAGFCHEIIISRKESAVKTHQACDTLRSQIPLLGGNNPSGVSGLGGDLTGALMDYDSSSWEWISDPKTEFCPTPRRSGPLLGDGGHYSSLSRAIFLLEEYYSQSAEAESATWRNGTAQQSAILPQLKLALEQLQKRRTDREDALEESSLKVKWMEERLASIKKERDKRWDDVYKAEEKVTRRMEALWKERSRQREKARFNQLREQNEANLQAQNQPNNKKINSTQEQVWDMVAAISFGMDSNSFEPIDLSDLEGSKTKNNNDGTTQPPPPPPPARSRTYSSEDSLGSAGNTAISREVMEEEARLPELRALAMAADDAIEECATQLLTCLSNLDTTRRSARVAAETALLAAANAQASTLKNLVKLERTALLERLRNLEELERLLPTEYDVRSELKAYIDADKKDRGGQSHLGDDDDGGIAAALAILSSHVNVANGEMEVQQPQSDNDDDGEIDTSLSTSTSRESIEEAVTALFEDPIETDEYATVVNRAISLLCDVAKENSVAARRRRSTICYSLNSKRSGNAALKSQFQFDALVKVFDAILTNCAGDEGGISNAKMIMMLSQTFYLQMPEPTLIEENKDPPVAVGSHEEGNSPLKRSPERTGRSSRMYVKSRLTKHAIWSKDDFWDEALLQQISESLTQSGVMAQFERFSNRAQRSGDVEYRKSRRMQWHDLNFEERVGAASQVHAVVFAQLGALAHSMIEFGCGLQRSCAFVRRMSIRHQLPSAQRTMLLHHLMERWRNDGGASNATSSG